MAFVDAAYANDQHKRRSTTGFVFTFCGSVIVYRSKNQSVTAISSTKAEFIAADFWCKDCAVLKINPI